MIAESLLADTPERENQSHLTARARTALSAPGADLLERGLLAGRILDYGCGRGDLRKFLNGDIEQWDPHFHPKKPKGKFDVVCCIYVLNVLSLPEMLKAIEAAREYVRVGGSLYIAVRRDATALGRSDRGTEQCEVTISKGTITRRGLTSELFWMGAPMGVPMSTVAHRKGSYEIYEWKKPHDRTTRCPRCGK